MDKRPFEDINFLDFTWAGVGPFTGNFLAYYGATVIRVESASRPDPVRHHGGYSKEKEPGLERGPVFAVSHPVRKMDLSLDLKNPKGIEIFKKLVAWADVIVENFTTGAIERMGLGYDELKKIKPSIILHRTNGFGHTGPMASQAGFGQTVTSLTGFHGITGWPDRASVPISLFYTDLTAPLLGALALTSAIDYMRRTGKGMCIDHSQVEAGINYLSPVILDYTANGRGLSLKGNSSFYAAPYGAYRCKGEDRWVAIGVYNDAEWQCFCQAIGNPEWTRAARFASMGERIQNSGDLDNLVNAWTINFTAEQAMSILQSHGVCAGVVASAEDCELDPQLKHYDFFRELEHPFLGKRNFYHPPGFKLSEATAEVARPPLLGENNEFICTEILGMSDEEFDRLTAEGVFK
jgi:benzylsuccinate CoA-transferase BbsF subunit